MPKRKLSTKIVDQGVPVDENLNTVCRSNEEGFRRILAIYTRPGCVIADVTHGNGTFWKLIDKDLYKVLCTDIREGTDFRKLPYPDCSVQMVALDPPYRYTPAKNKRHEDTPGHGKVDGLYSLREANLINTQSVFTLYQEGMREAHRVLCDGGFLVVKCQDTVQDGKNIWVHCDLITAGCPMGFQCRDILVVAPLSVLKTRWDRQRHLRKAHSYFLVFRKGGHFPFGIPSVCRR